MVWFNAKSAKKRIFGEYKQFIENQPNLVEKVDRNNLNLTGRDHFLYAPRLSGETASETVFKECVSCVALAIEQMGESASDAVNGRC